MESKKIDTTLILYLKGRLDAYLSKTVEKEINEFINIETSCNFIFNLKDVE